MYIYLDTSYYRYIRTCMHADTPTYIQTYIHTYTYTHAHTYTHTANCVMESKYRSKNTIYKCTVSAKNKEYKVYIGDAEGKFKTRFSIYTKSFEQKRYVKELKYSRVHPTLKWSTIKAVSPYSKIPKQ